jgi:proline dehydrogenase
VPRSLIRKISHRYIAGSTLAQALHVNDVHAELSIKPSALGLHFDEAGCKQHILRILNAAATQGVATCIDMEAVTCTQKTLELFAEVETAGADVGIVLRAYLRRTYDDIVLLQHRVSRVRICKGIYAEADVHLCLRVPVMLLLPPRISRESPG